MARPTAKMPPAARQRSAEQCFTPEVDILLLREVLAVDPFEDTRRWAAIVRKLSAVLRKNVVARSLWDRVGLLMLQFETCDAENLRESGKEEEYDEKERLLADVYHLARASGYKLQNSVVHEAAATLKRQKQQREMSRRPATEKRIAATIRDLGDSEIAFSESDCTSVDDELQSSHEEEDLWSTNVYDVEEDRSASIHGGYGVLATAPQLPASTSASTSRQRDASDGALLEDLTPSPTPGILPGPDPGPIPSTTPDPTLDPASDPHSSPILGHTLGSVSGRTPGSAPGPTRGLLPSAANGYMHTPSGICFRNRERREYPYVRFFEKRLQHEQEAKNRDAQLERERMALEKERLAVEDRRIALERDRISLDREAYLQRKREWEEAQQERREERLDRQRQRQEDRELYLRQQDALIDLVKSVVQSIKNK